MPSELECLLCCLRQLCCLCVKFRYPASGALVSFKHGAFLATLADFLANLSVQASHPIGGFFAYRLHLMTLFLDKSQL